MTGLFKAGGTDENEVIGSETESTLSETIRPRTRGEVWLAKMAGLDVTTPNPITRKERYMKLIAHNNSNSSNGSV